MKTIGIITRKLDIDSNDFLGTRLDIFDIFKDVKAWGGEQKNSGEKPSKSSEIFSPSGSSNYWCTVHDKITSLYY